VKDVTWENPGHALLHISTGDASRIREVVARCHLATNQCELAYDKTVNAPRLTLVADQ
jgi:hypothetical protein